MARLRRDIADRLNSYLWGVKWTKTETARLRNAPATIMDGSLCWSDVVVRGGVEPPTFRFSGALSRFKTKNANASSALLSGITTGHQPLIPM